MATDWQQGLDPAEVLDYVASFGGVVDPVLTGGETIASFSLGVTAEAALHGVTIKSAAPYAPSLVDSSTAIKLWLSVDPGEQDNEDFIAGIKLGVEATIVTNSTPPRTRQRTWNVEVKQL